VTYFTTREIAAISICATLWGVLNTLFAPIFFRMFGLPFLCDLIGFSVLILAAWWIRKLGSITFIGLIATAINFGLGGGFHFIGFTAASIFFDFATGLIGYETFKKSSLTIPIMMAISIVSAALAGFLIGTFFMSGSALANWGGVFGWAALHSIGGVIGGAIGTFLILALNSRKVLVNGQNSYSKKSNIALWNYGNDAKTIIF
jgi:hypothetical protein